VNETGGAGPSLVILAGGRASRYGGPKQFVAVGPSDEPLAAYALHDAAAAGFGHAVLVCPHGGTARAGSELVPYAPPGLSLAIVEQPRPAERTRPWGTAHALLAAGPAVGTGPFAVANADDFYGGRAFAVAARFLAEDAGGAHALVAYRLERTMGLTRGVSRAVCSVRDGWLTGIAERRDVRPAQDLEPTRDPLQPRAMHDVDPTHDVEARRGVEPARAEAAEPRAAPRPGGTGAPTLPAYRGRAPDGAVESISADARVSMNLWAFRPPLLDALARLWEEFRAAPSPDEEFALPGAVNRLLAEGIPVRVLDTDEEAFGLTSPEDLPRVRQAIARRVVAGAYPADLRVG
jgi:hypothetical protein